MATRISIKNLSSLRNIIRQNTFLSSVSDFDCCDSKDESDIDLGIDANETPDGLKLPNPNDAGSENADADADADPDADADADAESEEGEGFKNENLGFLAGGPSSSSLKKKKKKRIKKKKKKKKNGNFYVPCYFAKQSMRTPPHQLQTGRSFEQKEFQFFLSLASFFFFFLKKLYEVHWADLPSVINFSSRSKVG